MGRLSNTCNLFSVPMYHAKVSLLGASASYDVIFKYGGFYRLSDT